MFLKKLYYLHVSLQFIQYQHLCLTNLFDFANSDDDITHILTHVHIQNQVYIYIYIFV